jgi:hypothetical protein
VRVLRWVGSFLLGCAVGAVLHYALYRMSLPVEPFIYMAF